MTFDEIMLIIADPSKTDRQKGADLEAAFIRASKPSVKAIQPMKQRKPRQAREKVSPASESVNSFMRVSEEAPLVNGADHAG